MADAGTLYVQIGAKMDELTSALTQVAALLQQLSSQATNAGAQIQTGLAPAKDAINNVAQSATLGQTAATNLKGAIGQMAAGFTIGMLAVNLFHKAISEGKAIIEDCIKSALAYEEANSKLAAALEITGRQASQEIGFYQNLADAESKVTTYSKQQTLSAEALALQMTTLDEDGIKQVIQGAEGLAFVFGGDLDTRTRQVASGMEGVYGRLQMLIPALKNAGSESEKHAIFMKAIGDAYKAAQAYADTFGGQLKQLQNTTELFGAQMGDVVLKSTEFKTVLGLMKDLMDAFAAATDKTIGPLGILTEAIHAVGQVLLDKYGIALAWALKEQQEANRDFAAMHPTFEQLYHVDLPAMGQQLDRNAIYWMDLEGRVVAIEEPFIKVRDIAADLAKEFKDLGLKTETEITDKIKLAEKALADYIATGGKAPGIISKLGDEIKKLGSELLSTDLELDKFGHYVQAGTNIITNQFHDITLASELPARSFEKTTNDIIGDMYDIAGAVKDGWGECAPEFQAVDDALDKIADKVSKLPKAHNKMFQEINQILIQATATLGRDWGNLLDQWASGTITFKTFFEDIWKSILKFFLEIIGQMIAKLLFFNILAAALNLIPGIGTALSGAFKAAVGLGSAGASAGSIAGAELLMGQQGWQGIVSQPTLFLAGEAGPEGVSITPGGFGGGGSGGNMTINLNVTAMDGASVLRVFRTQLMPLIQDGLNRRLFTVPRNALGGI